jgi:hypothetical protein
LDINARDRQLKRKKQILLELKDFEILEELNPYLLGNWFIGQIHTNNYWEFMKLVNSPDIVDQIKIAY